MAAANPPGDELGAIRFQDRPPEPNADHPTPPILRRPAKAAIWEEEVVHAPDPTGSEAHDIGNKEFKRKTFLD
jgi:hypothetical protein